MMRGGAVRWSPVLGMVIGLALSAPAWAQQELTLTIRNHRFEPAEVTAAAGSKIVLKVTNADATPEEFESHDLNREKLIRPGQTITIHLPALKPGTYVFFGEFNPKTAQGRLVVK